MNRTKIKKFRAESNEALGDRLLKENADPTTIKAAFMKVYKDKKNITDEKFIESRAEIYMNIAKKRAMSDDKITSKSEIMTNAPMSNYQLNKQYFNDSFSKYIEACKESNWLSESEIYKFKFGRWLNERIDFENQTDEQIREICIKSQDEKYDGHTSGVNFLMTTRRFGKEVLELSDIQIIRDLFQGGKVEKSKMHGTLSLPKFSAWLATLVPERFNTCPNVDLIYSFEYLFDLKDLPRKGFNSFNILQDLLIILRSEIHRNLEQFLQIFNEITEFQDFRSVDEVWLVQDFVLFIRRKILADEEPESFKESKSEYSAKVKYWLYAPGRNAKFWDRYYKEGIMGIGPNSIGNFQLFKTRDSMAEKMKELSDSESSFSNDSLGSWQFSNEIKDGDIIIAKKGTKAYLGYGIVQSESYYNPQRNDYHNLRKVKWMSNGIWPEVGSPIVIKTLTDISKYPDYVNKLKNLLNIKEVQSEEHTQILTENLSNESSFWWMNANPKYWNIDIFKEGQQQTYTTHNNKGNKRRIYEYFRQLKPGDLIIGYQSTPSLKVKALFEVTTGIIENDEEGEVVTFRIKEFFPYQVSWEELKSNPLLINCEVFNNNQGSLFKLTESEFKVITESCEREIVDKPDPYPISVALSEIFFAEDQFRNILDLLEYKKNLILQGPPGTGKTFIAKRIAYALLGYKDPSRIEMIQFHQSYAYEDFIQGYRPTSDGTFLLQNGLFYDFCIRAQRDPKHKYFFIIDEINRGNLSKIFGELMMLIEHDKRGESFGIKLTYSGSEGDKFYIPENLYLIGTMNTADRSLAIVDYALRRRFVFIDIKPAFSHSGFEELLKVNKVPITLIKKIRDSMVDLNSTIAGDDNLRKSFTVGHSYFCTPVRNPDIEWYRQVIMNEIGPLLREYWFDDEDKAEENIKKLLRD